jgi:lipoprotein-releasing system permease protein
MSRRWLEWRIAARYLRSRRTARASLNTVIAIGGVAVGVTALIVVLGVMNGLRNDLRERILVANPHLRILTYGAGLRLDNWQHVRDVVSGDPDVVAVAPEVLTQSFITAGRDYAEGVNILGFDADTGKMSVTSLPSTITRGDLRFKTSSDSVDGGILMGARLASRMSVYPGDIVSMPSSAPPKRSASTGYAAPQWYRFEVTGLFETGMYQYDNQFVVISRPLSQRFAGLGDAVTGLGVRLRDPERAPIVAKRLEGKLGYPFRALDWQSQNDSLFSALQLEKLAMGLIIFFIMVVAAFNIVGTLTMVVHDKTREIGILQAMGLARVRVGRIFLLQGAVIGVLGTGIGLVLGLIIAFVLDRSGWIKINPAVYYIDHLPVQVEPRDVLVVVAASVALALVATIHPSRTAARLTPVEAIRSE